MAYDYATNDCSSELFTIQNAIEAKDEKIEELESQVQNLTERVSELEGIERDLDAALLEADHKLEAALEHRDG